MKLALVILCLASTPAWSSGYASEDIRPNVVWYLSIACDAGGDAHVGYYYVTNSDGAGVGYSRRHGGAWTTEVVAPQIATSVSGALDPAGQPHFAYATAVNPAVYYASHGSFGWASEPVDGPTDASGTLALAIDAAGVPHVAYPWGGELRHAWKANGAWQHETIDAALGSSGYPGTSLVIDPHGALAVSYHRGTTLVFARRTTTWTLTAVPVAPAYVGTSLAFDPAGEPWIAYCTADAVRLAHETAGGWTDEAAAPGGGPVLRFDRAGVANLAYYDGNAGSLVFARRLQGSWVPVTVDDRFRSGQELSMTLGPDGQPEFAYTFRGYVSGTLRYASAPGTVGVAPAVAGFSGVVVSPNPWRAGPLTLAFSLRAPADVSVQVHDVTGRLIASRAAESFAAGPGTIRWEPRGLGSGLYFVRLETTTGESAERRWTILR